MGKFFSDEVEQALEYIYYGMAKDGTNINKAFDVLCFAADKYDADACFLLARCYSGPSFMWEGFGVEAKEIANELYKEAILGGSSIGLIGGIRMGGLMEDPELKPYMEQSVLKKAYEDVYKMADEGEAFCQFLIGNSMYWNDIFKINGISTNDSNFPHLYQEYKLESMEWFKRAFDGGVHVAGHNLITIYERGEPGCVEIDLEKKAEIIKYGSEILKNADSMHHLLVMWKHIHIQLSWT